ncbi:YqiA/YcfP family alpha/beta fold hydrolase [Sulfuricurvum sp.]|uniref:YqiA/YcfP family alpha/beta fold hydrolase n=1 Tax=Sulfuricurvum sp. TaxID=2025608 RepID=UPI003454C93B
MIIYIHGFGSHGNGSKAVALRDFCKRKNIHFIAPSLSTIPDLAIQTLEELIESFQMTENVSLVGSSLGGYYAMSLSYKYNLPCVLINPAIYPYKTLSRALGFPPNFYDQSTYEWNISHLEMLKKHEVKEYSGENALLMVQTADEVLDYTEAVEKLSRAQMIIEEGGDHGFQGIERHFQTIIEFLDTATEPKFDIEKYKKVLEFAARAHGEQKTPMGYPYLAHIVSVASEIIAASSELNSDELDLAISCALLHDTIEDTATLFEEIEAEFGEQVAHGVSALTKNKSLSSKEEQMQESLKKLLQQPKAVQSVKLADRISNLSNVPAHWDEAKKKKYALEAQMIYDALKEAHLSLAMRLKNKIECYL